MRKMLLPFFHTLPCHIGWNHDVWKKGAYGEEERWDKFENMHKHVSTYIAASSFKVTKDYFDFRQCLNPFFISLQSWIYANAISVFKWLLSDKSVRNKNFSRAILFKLPNLFMNNYQQTLTKIILVKHCLYEPLLSKSLFIHVLFKYCNSSGKVYEVFHFLFSRNKLIQAWTQCKFQYFFVFLEVRVSVKHCSCILSTRVYQFF